jgi:hypothetical protein
MIANNPAVYGLLYRIEQLQLIPLVAPTRVTPLQHFSLASTSDTK